MQRYLLAAIIFATLSALTPDYSIAADWANFYSNNQNSKVNDAVKDAKKYCQDKTFNYDKCKKICGKDDKAVKKALEKYCNDLEAKRPVAPPAPPKTTLQEKQTISAPIPEKKPNNIRTPEAETKTEAEPKKDVRMEIDNLETESRSMYDKQNEFLSQLEKNSGIKSFFFGSDQEDVNKLREELVINEEQSKKVQSFLESADSEESMATVKGQLEEMKEQRSKIESAIHQEENSFSLFGWVRRIFP